MEKENSQKKELTVFETLRAINLEDKHKQKGKLAYLPWATAWATVKLIYPDAKYDIIRDDDGNRYHIEGKTCYVETSVTINGETMTETLAIMDNANKAILATDVTSTNVDKSLKRCLTKTLALFGLDLNLWEGEELSDEARELKEKQEKEDKKAKAELSKAIKEVFDLGNELFKLGVTNEAVMEIIKKINDGNGNPASLKTVEACATAKTELEKLKKTVGKPNGEEKKQ